MKRLPTTLGIVVIIAGFLVWWFHPHQALKRRSNGLMETLTIAEGSGTASRNLKVSPLSRMMAEEVTIIGAGDRRAEGTFPRSSVTAGFSWLARNARVTRFKIQRFESITRSGDTGVVHALIDAEVALKQETPLQGAYSMTLTWQNDGSAWRLAAVEWQPR
ncbi:MAG: DUF4440 domain-containing protein [Luteolibacter sp.]|jgi:ketosteroid isomerase-like protein